MKTLYKQCFVGLVCTIVLLMQTTAAMFTSPIEKKHFLQHLLPNKKKVKVTGLQMMGRIEDDAGTMGRVNITVFVDSVQYLTTTSNRSGKCKFTLPLNDKYVIVFSQKGYVTKKIVVYTKVPSSRMDLYKFHFTIDLFEEIKELDVSALEKPVAVVTYNNFMNQFNYDFNYTVSINEVIQKMYNDYYNLKKLDQDKKSEAKK